MFKVGDKVICINDDFTKVKLDPSQTKFPKKNKKYIIREIYISKTHPEEIGFLLQEIKNPPSIFFSREIGFNSIRFRKLDTIKESRKWSNKLIKQLEKELNEEEITICIDVEPYPNLSHHDIFTKNQSIIPIRKKGLCSISSTY